MNPVVAKKAMTVWQDAYPSRCNTTQHILILSIFNFLLCQSFDIIPHQSRDLLDQAKGSAFCEHATGHRECLSDDAGGQDLSFIFYRIPEAIDDTYKLGIEDHQRPKLKSPI